MSENKNKPAAPSYMQKFEGNRCGITAVHAFDNSKLTKELAENLVKKTFAKHGAAIAKEHADVMSAYSQDS